MSAAKSIDFGHPAVNKRGWSNGGNCVTLTISSVGSYATACLPSYWSVGRDVRSRTASLSRDQHEGHHRVTGSMVEMM